MIRAAVMLVFVAWCLATHTQEPTTTDSLARWQHAMGLAGETRSVTAERMPSPTAVITLPHRVLEPNRALWYARDMAVPTASALWVDSDDGAQVFVDGQLVPNHRRWFLVPESAAATRTVVIRVLNNAMQGGLRQVKIVAADAVVREPLGDLTAVFPPVESEAFRARMPPPADACRFTAWADSQGGWTTFAALVALMEQRRPHFSVGVGDLVNDGSDPHAWRSFVNTLAPLAARVPVVPVAGNHDYDGFYNDLLARHYLDWFRPDGTSWFAWSCGPARFAAIDVNREFPIGITDGSPQQHWLANELTSPAWRNARWRVLLVHQPPWSRSWEGYDGDQPVRAIVERLVQHHGLDLVIAGHSHSYEHLQHEIEGRSMHVLISGGAGGGLEAVRQSPPPGGGTIELRHHFADIAIDSRQLAVEAVGTDGRSFDRWTIRK